jgi:hypothetical protein
MCEQRGGRQRAREGLRRHRRGIDARLAIGVDELVFHSRDNQATQAAALVGKLAAFLEGDALGETLFDELVVDRIGQLDALLLERQILEIAPAGGLGFCLVGSSRRRRGRIVCLRLVVAIGLGSGERVELAELFGKLHLELRGVDALGLRHEDASFEHPQLQAQSLVRSAKLIALVNQSGDLLGVGGASDSLPGKRRFELGHSRVERGCVAVGHPVGADL